MRVEGGADAIEWVLAHVETNEVREPITELSIWMKEGDCSMVGQ